MMYRLKPAAILYKVGTVHWLAGRYLLKMAKYITLVNLLADEEIYPELLTSRDESATIAQHVLGWLNDPASRSALVARLEALRARVAVPGACDRAAEFLLGTQTRALRAAA